MSTKRPPATPGKSKTTVAKLPAKPARKGRSPATPAASESLRAAKRGAKAVAKIKAKAKPKVRAVTAKTPLAKAPDVAAKARAQSSAPAVSQARPRFRSTRPAKRAGAKSKGVALARFAVGDVVRHKFYPFRGVIFDIDPVFANTDDWWLSIPEQMRPKKNQPFYHLLAENAETEYIAYVSEQNLMPDTTGVPVRHPQVADYFVEDEEGRYRPVFMTMLN